MATMISTSNAHGSFAVTAEQMADARPLLPGPQDAGRMRVMLSEVTGKPVAEFRDVSSAAALLVMFAAAVEG